MKLNKKQRINKTKRYYKSKMGEIEYSANERGYVKYIILGLIAIILIGVAVYVNINEKKIANISVDEQAEKILQAAYFNVGGGSSNSSLDGVGTSGTNSGVGVNSGSVESTVNLAINNELGSTGKYISKNLTKITFVDNYRLYYYDCVFENTNLTLRLTLDKNGGLAASSFYLK